MLSPVDHPSPNRGPRRGGVLPDMVVLHYTGMGGLRPALERLCDPTAEVSAHYLIAADGTCYALVPEPLRAWHAGAGGWGPVTDVNSRSVGIELENPGTRPFAAPQMAALERLLEGVMERWRVPPERVIGHACMAPERKDDPGPRFDWRRLARRGLSIWPQAMAAPAAPDPAAFQRLAARFGYRAAPDDRLLAAFRGRFRPWTTAGPLDRVDMALLADLSHRWPAAGGD